jgi:hypothetical protein
MAINPTVKTGLSKEAERIEEDALFSGKGHYNACGPWQSRHRWLGSLSAILSAIAAGVASQQGAPPLVVVTLSVMAAALTAVVTFLKPNEEADRHRRSGDANFAIKNRARVFRTVELEADGAEEAKLVDALKALSSDLDAARAAAPPIPDEAYKKARREIEDEKTAEYSVDKPHRP